MERTWTMVNAGSVVSPVAWSREDTSPEREHPDRVGGPGVVLHRSTGGQVSAKMSRSLVSGTKMTPMTTVATAITIGYQSP